MPVIKFNKRFEFKNLPDMPSLFSQADAIAKTIAIGETLFMKEKGVKSEAEYKQKMAKTGRIMKHTHIGWNHWESTVKGTKQVYEELKKRGSYVDRFGYCLDWIMGVPAEFRHMLPPGTGLIFKNKEEWLKIGAEVPVQPHLGDHMICSLNSLENTQFALEAGVTTIGNISHYYTYEYPGLDMEEERVINMIKAIRLMGNFKGQGTVIHSNVDDGFGSQFHDIANLVGWVLLERYIVETLLGAGLSHCFGNLFSDPMLRIIFNHTMWETNQTKTPGSMIYGNTIDFGTDLDSNYGALVSFSMADCMGQAKLPTGHAVTVIPVTEALRVPSPAEIVQAHMTVDMAFKKAKHYGEFIDWAKVESQKNLLVTCGKIFFERVLNGLDDLNVDIQHAGEVFAALKAIGVEQLEQVFGVGQKEKTAMRNRVPIHSTNIVWTIRNKQERICEKIKDLDKSLDGYKVIVCSTDVHEFGKEIIKNILVKAGATVFDLGGNALSKDIFDTLIETESSHVIISTFNGIALRYATEIVKGLGERNLSAKIIMGGLLNECSDESDLPLDVTAQLEAMGISCDNNAENIIEAIRG